MKQFYAPVALAFLLFACKKSDNVLPPVAIPIAQANQISFSDGNNIEPLEGQILTKQAKNSSYLSRSWQGIPSIVADNNDNLFVAWYSGGTGEGPGNYVTISVSKDKGKTWAVNEAVIAPDANTLVRYFDPAMWKDPYGNIYFFWNKAKSTGNWDGRGGVWYSKVKYVNDTLKFEVPKRLAYGVMLNKPLALGVNNEIAFPISMWSWAPLLPNVSPGAFIYKGNFIQKGTFGKTSVIPPRPNLGNHFEHMVVELTANHLYALTRTDGDAVQYSNSYNNGLTWDTVKKFTAIGATTASRFFIGKLATGHLLLIINNSYDRSNLTACLSMDFGKTWPYKAIIATNTSAAISYPDAVQTSDGVIHMVHDYDRYGIGLINHIAFTEADLIAGVIDGTNKSTVSQK